MTDGWTEQLKKREGALATLGCAYLLLLKTLNCAVDLLVRRVYQLVRLTAVANLSIYEHN